MPFCTEKKANKKQLRRLRNQAAELFFLFEKTGLGYRKKWQFYAVWS